MISDSIIFLAGGNSEQMATIVTGLTTICAVHGHLFFGTNLPWPHEVFIEVLALGGEACQQVNGITKRPDKGAEHQNILCNLPLTQYSSIKSFALAPSILSVDSWGTKFLFVFCTGKLLNVL